MKSFWSRFHFAREPTNHINTKPYVCRHWSYDRCTLIDCQVKNLINEHFWNKSTINEMKCHATELQQSDKKKNAITKYCCWAAGIHCFWYRKVNRTTLGQLCDQKATLFLIKTFLTDTTNSLEIHWLIRCVKMFIIVCKYYNNNERIM